MKTSDKKHIGSLGEHIGANYLRSKGYEILSLNFWRPYGELDVIAKKDRVVHFVEIKTVVSGVGKVTQETWNQADKIDTRKLGRMVKTIEAYVAENRIEGDWQMDALLVTLDTENKKAKVEFIENISPYS